LGRTIVVGAGLAGLVAAERISAQGGHVLLLEASANAGGRCRSYFDRLLERRIDNGNHLILSANRAVLGWAARIGGADKLHIAQDAEFPFLDLGNGQRWTLAMTPGVTGAMGQAARPPGVTLTAAAVQMARLGLARRGQGVGDVLSGDGPLWHGFWDPMTRAILNADPATADAGLLRATMLRSFARGASACRPVFATEGLGAALIDPALALLARRGVVPRLRTPVRDIAFQNGRVSALLLADGPLAVANGDTVILALPSQAAAALLPDLVLPGPGQTIVNAHFILPDNRLPPILGVLGGAAPWLFRRGDVVSITVSAAEASPVAGLDRDTTLATLWHETARAVRAHGGVVPDAMPTARLLRERAATFDQSTRGAARRHGTRTRWPNLLLAGDHVTTGLPATLEGAVISGERAAAMSNGQGKAQRWRQ